MNEFNFIKRTIYDLKRRYPTQITLKVAQETAVDLTSGEILSPTTDYIIDRAILLPKETKAYNIPGLNTPADLSITTRQLLIAAEDLPANLELRKENTQIIYNNEVWDISSLDLIENYVYDIKLKEVEGSIT